MDPPSTRVPFEDYFGEPVGVANARYYTNELPKAYVRENEYLKDLLLETMFKGSSFATSTLMPMNKSAFERKHGIIWDEFNFVCTLLSPKPAADEGSIDRLVSQAVSEHKEHWVRYGLSFALDHGFSHTPEGILAYKKELKEISDASLSGLHVDVIQALLACDVGRDMSLSPKERMKLDCERFAEVQKSDQGWNELDARARASLEINGATPNAWVLDSLVGGCAGTSAGATMFTTKPLKWPGLDDPVNILSRERTIGEYTTSFPSPGSRDIMVYDASTDHLAKVKLSEGLAHCMRFDDNGDLAALGFIPGCDHDGSDMFFTDTHPDGVRYFFQMHEAHMPLRAVEDWTAGVIEQFDPVSRAELCADIAAHEELANRLPSGYQTYAEICDLASHRITRRNALTGDFIVPTTMIIDLAIRAKRAVDTLCTKFDEVCFGNLFTGQHRDGKSSESTVTCNLLRCFDGVAGLTGTEDLKAYGEYQCRKVRNSLQKTMKTPLELAIGVAFLGNAAHGKTLTRFINTKCVFPFNMVYARPYQTYEMSAGICMQGGSSTGETFVEPMSTHFNLYDDVPKKMHYGTFSLRSKPIVHKKQNVHVARDMFCSAYCGGAGTNFVASLDQHDEENIGHKSKSVYALLTPYQAYESQSEPMDLSEPSSATLASGDFYRMLWEWTTESSNTVCFQGHQVMYNPKTDLYDIVVQNQGHWRGVSQPMSIPKQIVHILPPWAR